MGLVTADKTVEEQADVLLQKLGRKGQQPQQQQQVGLLLGRLSSTFSSSPSSTLSSRDLLFGLVPTPPSPSSVAAASENDSSRDFDGDGGAAGGSSSKKKGKGKGGRGGGAGSNADANKGAVSVQIDEEWVAEHARQVLRMCVGGVSVVGMFVVASDAVFKASAPAINIALAALRSTVQQHHQATAEAVATVLMQHSLSVDAEEVAAPAAAATPTAAAGDLLLLHVSNGPKKLSLYNSGSASAAAASASTALKPQPNLRVAAGVVSSLVPIRTSFDVDSCIYVPSLLSSSTEAARQQWFAALRLLLLKAVMVAQARTLATARCARAVAAETMSSDAATNSTYSQPLTLLDERDAGATVGDLMACGKSSSEHSSGDSTTSSSKPSKRGGKGKGSGGSSSANQPQSSSPTPIPTLQIELLSLPSAACATVGCPSHTATNDGTEGGSAAIGGVFRLRGRLCGVSYASPRDSMAAAVADLKVDVLRSLHHRLEIMLEDAEQQLEEEGKGGEGEADGEGDGGTQEQPGTAAEEDQDSSKSSRLLLRLLGDPTAEARHLTTGTAAVTAAAVAGTTATTWQLPLRVLLPWTPLWDSSVAAADGSSSTSKQATATHDSMAGRISLCDFLLSSEAGEESPSVAVERFVATVPAVIRGVAPLASLSGDDAGMTGLRSACQLRFQCPEAMRCGSIFASVPSQSSPAAATPPWSGGPLGAKEVRQSGAKPFRSEDGAVAPPGLSSPSLDGSAATALQLPSPLSWLWAIIVLLTSLAAGSLLVSQHGQKL